MKYRRQIATEYQESKDEYEQSGEDSPHKRAALLPFPQVLNLQSRSCQPEHMCRAEEPQAITAVVIRTS